MERSYRDLGRSGLASAVDYDDYGGGYDLPVRGASGAGAYLDREHVPLRDSYLSSSSSSSYRSPRGGFDREIMESLVQQRALQQQLSLRESQLALASSLLQQQQHQQYFNKRRMDEGGPGPRGGEYRNDFKRPRMMDNRSRPRNRTSGRDSYAGSRPRGGVGSRGSSGGRRYQSSSRGHGSSSSDRSKNTKDNHDPEKPTADDDNKLRCRVCSVEFKDDEEMKKHRDSSEHKEKSKAAGEAGHSRTWYCHVCDTALTIPFLQHQRMTFHKKRKIQVMKGCGWCKVTSFKNFTEVLAHRSTEEHIKHQNQYGKKDFDEKSNRTRDSQPRRERIKVEMPPELAKFDSKVAVGVAVVVPASGWFCKVCNKFYNNETSAKSTHCMTEPHFNNYRKYMYQKLKTKAEAERDAKEQAEKEERKKKEEEEKAAKAANGGDGDDAAATDASATDAPGEQGAEEAGEGQDEDVAMEEDVVIEDEEGGQGEGEEEEGGVGDWAEEVTREEEDYAEEGVEEEEGAAAAAEESVDQEGGEEQAEAVEEEEPMVTEEVMEGEEGGEEAQEEEEVKKKATRASVSSSPGGRGRGRGAGGNRARRGRRIAK